MQYFTDLPVVLVALHLLGAALTSAAMTWLLLGTRERVAASRRLTARCRGSAPCPVTEIRLSLIAVVTG